MIKNIVNGAVRAAKAAIQKTRQFVADNSRKLAVAVGVGVSALAGTTAHAQSSSTPDASTIVSTAQTTFDSVGALVAAAVGFFIIVKIVKWIRK